MYCSMAQLGNSILPAPERRGLPILRRSVYAASIPGVFTFQVFISWRERQLHRLGRELTNGSSGVRRPKPSRGVEVLVCGRLCGRLAMPYLPPRWVSCELWTSRDCEARAGRS